MLKSHLYAQRVGRDKIIYMFDENPLEAQYHMREDLSQRFGPDIPARFVHSVRDCMSIGKWDGFEYIGVKLSPEEFKYTEDERKDFEANLQALRHLKLAATNVEAIKQHKDRGDSYKQLLESTSRDLAAMRSERERMRRALAAKGLGELGEPVIKQTTWRSVRSQFFTWQQLTVALIVYLVTPNIMQYSNVTYPDPSTVALAALALAVAAFFSMPIVLGLIKR